MELELEHGMCRVLTQAVFARPVLDHAELPAVAALHLHAGEQSEAHLRRILLVVVAPSAARRWGRLPHLKEPCDAEPAAVAEVHEVRP